LKKREREREKGRGKKMGSANVITGTTTIYLSRVASVCKNSFSVVTITFVEIKISSRSC
jgi:hypothetical protein